MDRISLAGLKKVLSPHEMRNVLGGSLYTCKATCGASVLCLSSGECKKNTWCASCNGEGETCCA